MIAHDSDTDVCYLSHAESPADLILESYRIEREMRRRGWTLLRMSGGDIKLLLSLSDGRQCHIDVFVAFRVADTFYQLGNRSGQLPESAILPLSTVVLHGFSFPAPAHPEQMLAFVYGPGWRVPDPSFKYADPVPGIRRLDGWLRGFRTDMGRWTEFYRGPEAKPIRRRRSTFARWVDTRSPSARPWLTWGRHRARLPVLRPPRPRRRGVRLLPERAGPGRPPGQATGLPIEPRLLILNELRSVLVAGAELARERRHLYARQLIGCLDDAARDNLWTLARMAARGRQAVLEFSALSDHPDAADPAPSGLVRRVDPAPSATRSRRPVGGSSSRSRTRRGHARPVRPQRVRMRVTFRRPGPQKRRAT